MANPTTNFGWVMPAAVNLVTDLPADFDVFGQAVDTDFVGLKGGTTGQVLAKASATDLDFVWSADAAGMTNPMTTTGDVIYSSSGSTPARLGIGTDGQVLTSDGSIVNWETPSADIPLSTVTTNGDVIYATGSGAVTRLGIGSTDDVLTVAGGVPTWAAPSGGGGADFSLLNAGGTALSGTTTTVSGISGMGTLLVMVVSGSTNAAESQFQLRLNGDTANNYAFAGAQLTGGSTYSTSTISNNANFSASNIPLGKVSSNTASTLHGGFYVYGANSTGIKGIDVSASGSPGGGNNQTACMFKGRYSGTSTISSVSILLNSGSFDAGTVYVYGSAV